ncbi:MAG: hypothetical protein LBH37_02100 [Oscillospiraceae bacterium]|jgi:hypothetical protein|nr:hypothetical protein [Oscillospiraceae bacterium]
MSSENENLYSKGLQGSDSGQMRPLTDDELAQITCSGVVKFPTGKGKDNGYFKAKD